MSCGKQDDFTDRRPSVKAKIIPRPGHVDLPLDAGIVDADCLYSSRRKHNLDMVRTSLHIGLTRGLSSKKLTGRAQVRVRT